MNHTFQPSLVNESICRICKYGEVAHTKDAVCEVCGETGVCDILYGNILMCKQCQDKEAELQAKLKDTESERVNAVSTDAAQRMLDRSKQIDLGVNVDSELHNAKTMAIIDLKRVIDADPSIENKNFKLAEVIEARYLQLKDIFIPEKRKEIADAETEIRAIQTYYYDLATKLKQEERDKLKLKDINYKPVEPKQAKPKPVRTRQADKIMLAKVAGDIETEFPALKGTAMAALQTIIVAQNVNAEAAGNIMRLMLNKNPNEQRAS